MPFGEEAPVVAQGSSNTRQFTGHERDAESGLDYMMARYHTPSFGRFLAADLIGGQMGSAQSWNKYSYVRNRAIDRIDPNGRQGIDPFRIDQAAIDRARGLAMQQEAQRQMYDEMAQRRQTNLEALEAGGDALEFGGVVFGGATLLSAGIPVLGEFFGAAAVTCGSASVGVDFVLLVLDPSTGERWVVVIVDGVTVAVGKWAGNAVRWAIVYPVKQEIVDGISELIAAGAGSAINGVVRGASPRKSRSRLPDPPPSGDGVILHPENYCGTEPCVK